MAEENFQKPSKGRIVLVRSGPYYDAEEFPAIVVAAHEDGAVDVCWFTPNGVVAPMRHVPHESQAESVNATESWRWPPRV